MNRTALLHVASIPLIALLVIVGAVVLLVLTAVAARLFVPDYFPSEFAVGSAFGFVIWPAVRVADRILGLR